MTRLYPLLLDPALKPKVWGGRRLQTHLGKPLPTDDPYGEAWELHDSACIANGDHAGRSVADLLADAGRDLIGAAGDPAQGMPLLIKFLDACDWLSVQVHPDDALAAALADDPRGKTEAWIVLDAAPDSQIIDGVIAGATVEGLRAALADGTLVDYLRFTPVSVGTIIPLTPGTIHALGSGLLIYEVQQSSDITYRLYDWDRAGLDGQPRDLHIEQAFRCAQLDCVPPMTTLADAPTRVITTPYFTTDHRRMALGEALTLPTDGVFHAVTCISGSVRLDAGVGDTVDLPLGGTALIPAALPTYQIVGTSADPAALLIAIPAAVETTG